MGFRVNFELSERTCMAVVSLHVVSCPPSTLSRRCIKSPDTETFELLTPPHQAVSMNDSYLADDDYSGVQSVEDIQALLSEAQTPGPSKYNFQVRSTNSSRATHASHCQPARQPTPIYTNKQSNQPTSTNQPTYRRNRQEYEEGGDGFGDLIDDAIEEELAQHPSSKAAS